MELYERFGSNEVNNLVIKPHGSCTSVSLMSVLVYGTTGESTMSERSLPLSISSLIGVFMYTLTCNSTYDNFKKIFLVLKVDRS